jgi:hypothetical protein
MSPDKKKIEKIYSQLDKLATKGKEYIYEYHKLIDDLIVKGDYNYFEQTLYYKYDIDITDFESIVDVKNKTWEGVLFQTNTPISKKIKKLLDKKGVYQMVFDIYNDSINNLNLSVGSPLSSTYSTTSSTQVVSLTRNGNNIYVDTNDNNIYNIDIYYSQWEGNTPVNNSIKLLQTISPTQSVVPYLTEIPTTQGGSYLIRTNMASQTPITYYELNYKVQVDRSYLLGQIVEIDKLSADAKYYLQNKQFAKVIGARVTYLEVTKAGATSSILVDNSTPNASEDTNLVNRYRIAVDYLLS